MININKIATTNLKTNKLRSVLIIITIALTTCLLSAMGIIMTNAVEQTKAEAIKTYGNAHGFYRKLDEEKINSIKNHKDIEIVGESSALVGQYELDGTKLSMAYMDKNEFELTNIFLEDGRAPEAENEIVLDRKYIEKLGFEPKVGNAVKLNYHDIKGNSLEKEFIISGIQERSEGQNIFDTSLGIVSKDFIKNEESLSGDEIEYKVGEVAEELKFNKDDVAMNTPYLMSAKTPPEMILAFAVVAIVIMVSAVLVLYNIFYIEIVGKIQEFGKLKAIGATKKQIKKIVLKEGIILSIIGIPIGIILGSLVSTFILVKVMKLNNASSINLFIMIMSVLLTIVTVYLSLTKPMKIASKISPIEAVRYNSSDSKSKKKTRKGYIDLNIVRLTCSNLFRNKKRTWITILSLSLSGILIISVSTVIQSMNTEGMVKVAMLDEFQFEQKYATFEIEKERENFMKNNPLNKDFVKSIQALEGVKKVNEIREVQVSLENRGLYKEEYPEDKSYIGSMTGYEDDTLNKLKSNVKSGKINIDKIKSGEEVIINTRIEKWLSLGVGDKVKLTYNNDAKKIEKEVKVQAIASTGGNLVGDFVTSIVHIKNTPTTNYNSLIEVDVEDKYYDAINTSLKNMAQDHDNLEYTSFKDEVKYYNQAYFGVNAMGYGIVAIIGSISLVNLINTMITSIISRKRELGILQTIGMSDKQLKKMLNIEGLFYTKLTIISSLALGGGIGYIIYKIAYNNGMDYMTYKYPIIPAILIVVVSILTQVLITYFINKEFNKESLVDRVRHSE